MSDERVTLHLSEADAASALATLKYTTSVSDRRERSFRLTLTLTGCLVSGSTGPVVRT